MLALWFRGKILRASTLGMMTACCLLALRVTPVSAQRTVVLQEGFNDDGDGSRYFMDGRGNLLGPDGPGMWEHNFLVETAIGLPSTAPARRAAILWTDTIIDLDWRPEAIEVWDGLVDWSLDGKQNANILWIPGAYAWPTPDFLAARLEDAGHTTIEHNGTDPLPDSSTVDLVIHTSAGALTPPTAFVDYAVPVITFNGANHDDTLISSIGAVTTGGPREVTVVEANQDHPILGGKTGTVPWLDDFLDPPPALNGIGASVPAGSTTLLTYTDPATGLELPALVVVEEGDPVLGAFAPVPEGAGFIVGGDMNLEFEVGQGFTTELMPRRIELPPVDVSGQENVQVTVALAATNVDFEAPDFLRIVYAPDDDSEFQTLTEFLPVSAALTNGDIVLSPDAFTDVTMDIPEGATNLRIAVEAYSTFPNEIVGIDNIRITSGADPVAVPGDFNADGVVDVADLDLLGTQIATMTGDLNFDVNGDGQLNTDDVNTFLGGGIITSGNKLNGDVDFSGDVQFPDFVVLADNFGQDGVWSQGDFDASGQVQFPDFVILANNFGQSAAAAQAVPEPGSALLLLIAGVAMLAARRKN